AKLAIISDTSTLVDLTLNPLVTSPPPTDDELVTSISSTAAALRLAASGTDAPSVAARRLAGDLERLAPGSPAPPAPAPSALLTPTNTMLDQIRGALVPQPVTLDSLPPDIVSAWKSADGRYRLSAAPKGDANNNAVLEQFIDAVAVVAPDVTGTPVGIREG